jgi:hypothetical protein
VQLHKGGKDINRFSQLFHKSTSALAHVDVVVDGGGLGRFDDGWDACCSLFVVLTVKG